MRRWKKSALALYVLGSVMGGLSACSDGGPDSRSEGDVADLPPPDTAPPVEDTDTGNSTLPLLEDFGTYTGFDQSDTIDFFSPGYKSLAGDYPDDPRPALYYPTCCFFADDDPNGEITVDHKERLGIVSDNGDPSLLISDARFSIGQTRSELADPGALDPKKNSTPGNDPGTGWGELDLSQPYRISFCVAAASGSGSSTQIYVDNNSTSEASSIHGGGSTGSRIFNVPTDSLVPGERVTINVPGDTFLSAGGEAVDVKTDVIGTEQSFLQLRVSSGGTAIIDDLLIEAQSEDGAAALPDCNEFTPATAPDPLAAPGLFASDAQIAASWDTALGAGTYDLAYGTSNDVNAATVITGITDTQYTLDSLANGSEYFVFVRAVNNVGPGEWSEPASATPEAPVGDNCTPTTTVDPSAANAILWNVYDGCLAPGELGSVVINGSTATNFDLADDEKPYFSSSELGIMTLDTAGADAKPVGDLADIIAGDATTYPKHFTFIARIDTSLAFANGYRGFEIETHFGDGNQRRVKTILRPDSGDTGRLQMERFLSTMNDDPTKEDTAQVDLDMSDDFHIYQVNFTVNDPASSTDNISAVIYRDGIEVGNFSGNGRDGGSSGSLLRIGEGSSSEFHAALDWMLWSDNSMLADLLPDELVGELPTEIGELGVYAGVDASLVYEETFSGPVLTDGDGSGSNFFTTGYRALASDAGKPLYNVTSSGSRILIADTASDGNLSLNNARFSIGDALPETDTADSDTSTRGDLDLSKPYTITFEVLANSNVVDGDNTGKCQVYVDNNTSSSSQSIHGGDSKIFEKLAPEIADGDTATGTVTISSEVGSASSFLQLRCDSRTEAPITIDNLTVSYQ